VNGDGKPDLATATASTSVSVLLRTNTGYRNHVDYPTAELPSDIASGDFNGDGFVDLITANYGTFGDGRTVSVLLGNGDGTFKPHLDSATDKQPRTLVVGDFNTDGKLDVIVTSLNPPFNISLLRGNGDGTFQALHVIASHVGTGIAVGDFRQAGPCGGNDINLSG
jgi:hypothetical protein